MSESDVVATPDDTTTPTVRPPTTRSNPGPLFFVALAIAVVATSTLAVVAVRNHLHSSTSSTLRVSGLPASVSTPLAQLMFLSPVPARPAPTFTLTDQLDRTLSLQRFRGRTVVLEFMDPHCVDICPLVSKEFVDAYHDLGTDAHKVVFMAVNVNPYFESVANMMAFSRSHQLETIPSWHFFTGTTAQLRSVWHHYNVTVEVPSRNADIIHTSIVYFIDPRGHERYIATPSARYTKTHRAFLPGTTLASWGQGIALVAKSLLR